MKSPISYVGGKRLLAKTIVNMIPEHICYVELFSGGAGVFFRKEPSKIEVLNDLYGELVNLWRVIKNHPDEFIMQFEFLLVSREHFETLKAAPTSSLTDVQRAARYFYIQKLTFGGRVTRRSYGYNTTSSPRLNL